MPSRRQQKIQQRQQQEIAERKQKSSSYVNQAPFRYAERNFKSRIPPPDFSHVVDVQAEFGSRDSLIEIKLAHHLSSKLFGHNDQESRPTSCFAIKDVPGLLFIPNPFTPQAQRHLIRQCLSEYARAPNTSNLDTHYQLPEKGLWQLCQRQHAGAIGPDDPEFFVQKKSDPETPPTAAPKPEVETKRTLVPACSDNFRADLMETKVDPPPADTVPILPPLDLMRKLRWVTLGYQYHWPTKTYHFDRRYPMPPEVSALTKAIAVAVEGAGCEDGPRPWKNHYKGEHFVAQAGVVNFYQYRDTLMGHVDRSELNMDAPLVSISLGNACIYLIGGPTRDTVPVPIYLRSGDIIVMTEPCRHCFHGVPRIMENTLPDYLAGQHYPDAPDWQLYGEYMSTSRINLNVRQVFKYDETR